MDSELDNKVTDDDIAKIAWQRPAIERIDIKRTMGGNGSFGDSPTGTTSFNP